MNLRELIRPVPNFTAEFVESDYILVIGKRKARTTPAWKGSWGKAGQDG